MAAAEAAEAAKFSADDLAAEMDKAAARAAWRELETAAGRMIEAFPGHPAGPARLREALAGQGRGHEAAGLVKAALKTARTSRMTGLYDNARRLREARRPDEALAAYQAVLACQPRGSTAGLIVK